MSRTRKIVATTVALAEGSVAAGQVYRARNGGRRISIVEVCSPEERPCAVVYEVGDESGLSFVTYLTWAGGKYIMPAWYEREAA